MHCVGCLILTEFILSASFSTLSFVFLLRDVGAMYRKLGGIVALAFLLLAGFFWPYVPEDDPVEPLKSYPVPRATRDPSEPLKTTADPVPETPVHATPLTSHVPRELSDAKQIAPPQPRSVARETHGAEASESLAPWSAVPAFQDWGAYRLTALEQVLHIKRPSVGSANCSGNGHWVRGVRPYCECFTGWAGDDCARAAPTPSRPKGCMVFLMYGDTKYAHELAATLPSLDRYFLDRHRYPIVIFHSPNFARAERCNATHSASYLDLIRAHTKSEVIFEEVSPDFRPEMRAKYGERGPKSTCTYRKYPLGYYHMCRFFNYLMFHSQTLKQFEYVWRMDGNIALSRPITCDPFAVLRDTRALYGFYRWDHQEPKGCTGPIREWGFEYAKQHGFTPAHLDRVGSPERGPRLYLGAWGVFKWSFFTSQSWLDFIETVDVKGFVYHHRLGEQVLYAHALGLLVPAEALHQFGGFSPLIHRNQPIWPYAEWGVRRQDPFCEWRARHVPWRDAPASVTPPQWAEAWPEKRVMDGLKEQARKEEASQKSPCPKGGG